MSQKKGALNLTVETAVYPKEAVLAAANTFAGRAYVRVGGLKKARLCVSLAPKPGAQLDAAALEGEFFNELLHHALRLKITARNQALREKIVAQALMSGQFTPGASKPAGKAAEKPADDKALEKEIENLLKEAEAGGYKGDPLGIAVPWEKNKETVGAPPDVSWEKLKEAYPDGPPDIAALWEKGKAAAMAGQAAAAPAKKAAKKSGKKR